MKTFDFKKETSRYLSQRLKKDEANELKERLGVKKTYANKGVLLIASLFDLAVSKGSVPAAKELISLCSKETDSGGEVIARLLEGID